MRHDDDPHYGWGRGKEGRKSRGSCRRDVRGMFSRTLGPPDAHMEEGTLDLDMARVIPLASSRV